MRFIPTAPVLLTKNGPLGAHIHCLCFIKNLSKQDVILIETILRKTSEETSYYFRPNTRVRQSISTSESLRSFNRVSSSFILLKYSSPSFWMIVDLGVTNHRTMILIVIGDKRVLFFYILKHLKM
ncbi:unnamed protein product [Brugia pahangi]|uniref:Uncharacterized protein n=1 Tax=Brugia pahangi TaxID=6280 RepID=A0A3P7RQV5_BRUPA|nr:unnamed protein product [Brugia pahangi]